MKIVAVVPVKAKSDRVPSKNFREFADGKSLFELLVDKLTASDQIEKVYISTNELSVKEYVADKGCHFLLREDDYCNNEISWSDVIAHVVGSLPEDDDVSVMWCHTTSPLFDRYDEAIQAYCSMIEKGDANGLISVARLSEFIVTERNRPLNYSWGVWHPYSQNLEKLYSITGALFIAKKGEMLRNRYVISSSPYFFETTAYEAIDLDTPFDFELAKLMYLNRDTLSSLD